MFQASGVAVQDDQDKQPPLPKPLWPLSLFSNNDWMTKPRQEHRTECWACGASIKPRQKFCTECKHWQTARRHFSFSQSVLALLVALAALSVPIFDRIYNFLDPTMVAASLAYRYVDEESFASEDQLFGHELIVTNSSRHPAYFSGQVYCLATFTVRNVFFLLSFDLHDELDPKERYINNISSYIVAVRSWTASIVNNKHNQESLRNWPSSDAPVIGPLGKEGFLNFLKGTNLPEALVTCDAIVLHNGAETLIDVSFSPYSLFTSVIGDMYRLEANQTKSQPPADMPAEPEDPESQSPRPTADTAR
ncbi:MAG: hypothetical protein ABJL55_16270 [Roseibium sp.]